MTSELTFRKVSIDDISQLLDLINRAYREQIARSWTNEAELVAGLRIDEQQLRQTFANQDFHLYVAELSHEHSSSAIVACIGLSFNLNEVEIGTFSVDPSLQNTGIGKTILSFAEEQALLIQPYLEAYVMYVLDVRTELVAYYQRRGY